jgi:MSHA biogenesis protein MshQ
VRTNDNTQACEVVAEQISQVDMGMHCVNPGSCSNFIEFPDAQMSAKTPNGEHTLLNELQEDSVGGFSGWIPVTTDFQAGQQELDIQYGDAGRVSLRAKAQLPNGKVIEGVSNEFVYKPASIGMETVSSYSGDILAKAGESFFVTLQALNSDDQVTPNFGRETPQELLDVMSTTTPVAPSVEDGEIENASGFTAQSVESIRFENDSISYSEVGSVKVTAKVADGDYLGTGPVTTEHIIGRFIPYEFEPITTEFTGLCTDFYYMGQPQSIELSARAVNASGDTTLNYTGPLAKATPLFYAYDSSGNQLVNHAVSYTGVWEWGDGVGQFTGAASVTVSRLSSGEPDGPFKDYILGWQLDDQEDGNFYSTLQNGVLPAPNGAAELDSANLYYGRLNLQDTYAAMDDVMPIAGSLEYWDGAAFVQNRKDNCETLANDAHSFVEGPLEPTKIIPISTASAENGDVSPSSANIKNLLRWDAAITDEPYSFTFELDVPSYLKYDWPYNDDEVQDGSDYTDNPQAEGTFGIYRGRDRQIYWRELGW